MALCNAHVRDSAAPALAALGEESGGELGEESGEEFCVLCDVQ